MNKFLITIVGPTAIGKTSLAIKLAKHYQTEVISADSRQFYKELNIGTAKPTSEELSSVKHHLINNISVTDDYDISQFQSDAREKINNVFKMKDFAIMVGGSGLYIDSVLYGIDEIPKIDKNEPIFFLKKILIVTRKRSSLGSKKGRFLRKKCV